MSSPRTRAPGMFYRRLMLLGWLIGLGFAALAAQLARLTIVQGAQRRAEAESRLVVERWTPTVRGRILDRKGRVLALDKPSYDVAVDFRVITGSWAYAQAADAARRDHRDDWAALSARERETLIEERLPPYRARLDDMWNHFARIAGVSREEIERRKQRIIAEVQRMASTIWERRRLERERELSSQREVTLDEVKRPIREQRSAHPILRDVPDAVAFEFRRFAQEAPGIEVRDAGKREYPFESMEVELDRSTLPEPMRETSPARIRVEGVATHVVGWMRDTARAEDMQRRRERFGRDGRIDRGRYEAGDPVGSAGVEREFEDVLRGLRGRVARRLDTGRETAVEAAPGADVKLTLDIDLQARAQAILAPQFGLTLVQPWHDNQTLPAGAPLAAGAVVLDAQTGDILALATNPTFTRAAREESPEAIYDDPVLAPWADRAFARPYQPGSIVKPLVLVEAVSRGAHDINRRIECTGHFLPNNPNILRCWIYRERFGYLTHSQQVGGPLGPAEAIARSCNIFFYTLGQELGAARLASLYMRLGVGKVFSAGLEGMSPGLLGQGGSLAALDRYDAPLMGIGQGPVSWTPLHAAAAYAALARNGEWIEPSVVQTPAQPEARRRESFGWDKRAIAVAFDGLGQAVGSPWGTGHHIFTAAGAPDPIFNAPGVRIVGKTGTAQGAPIVADPDGDGPEQPQVVRQGDHAWTVVLVGPKDGPLRYAIAVVVEFGGSGGRVAGPIANQLIHALIHEGYVSSAADAEPPA